MKLEIPIEEENDRNWELEVDYFRGVQEANNFKAVWSVFDKGIKFDEKLPDGFDKIKAIVNSCSYFNYHIEVPFEGETWLDLYKAANEAIEKSGDSHIYIEGFLSNPSPDFHSVDKAKLTHKDGEYLYIITGS